MTSNQPNKYNNYMATTDIPITEGIKYAGSKLKLLPHILARVQALPGVQTVFDGFCGTTRVSQALARAGYTVTANDISAWSEVFAQCYLKADKPDSFYADIITRLNALPGKNGWFSAHYGGQEQDTKKPFRLKNMQKLDAVREEIDSLGLEWADKCVLLTSLILALDKVDSTLGHFTSYLARWSVRSKGDLTLKLPRRPPYNPANRVLNQDVFSAVQANHWDLAYFDPPYGSNNDKMPSSRVRYNAYYHFWTTVVKNDKPPLFGTAGRREDSRDSSSNPFEDFHTAPNGRFTALNAVDRLLQETNARYILFSYASCGRIPRQDLLDALCSHGELISADEMDYKQNIMADLTTTNEWSRPKRNKEYLFLIKKGT
uniref:site-specific DNA-methyltransferase (adenine-specific) n=1 Tax=uncultured Elusimicrobia bacterium TaxID=699876 RepID=A0A650ELV2_9BACT|nr:hypothetical protein Elusimicrob1349_1700 [uncultured Elusimicrobia bacterium]